MKTRMILILLAGCAGLFLTRCDVKDPIYNTPHPEKGAVVLTTDWTQHSEDVTLPAEYVVKAGEVSANMKANMGTLPGVFDPGRLDVLVYNTPEKVTVNAEKATVQKEGSDLVPDPGILFSGAKEVTVVADDTVRTTMAMQQRMREVQFTMTVTKGDPERITGATVRLSGVAASLDLRTGEVTGETASVAVKLTRIGEKLQGHLWVLGILPNVKQEVTVELEFMDDMQKTETWDAGDKLKDFNANKLVPAKLEAQMDIPLEIDMGGSIVDWTVGSEHEVEGEIKK